MRVVVQTDEGLKIFDMVDEVQAYTDYELVLRNDSADRIASFWALDAGPDWATCVIIKNGDHTPLEVLVKVCQDLGLEGVMQEAASEGALTPEQYALLTALGLVQ